MKKIILICLLLLSGFAYKPICGIATVYHSKFEGRRTADGSKFSQKKLTAASNLFPLGTVVKVTNLSNKKEVIVTINDRSAKWTTSVGRIIDLSKKANNIIDGNGYTKVRVEAI